MSEGTIGADVWCRQSEVESGRKKERSSLGKKGEDEDSSSSPFFQTNSYQETRRTVDNAIFKITQAGQHFVNLSGTHGSLIQRLFIFLALRGRRRHAACRRRRLCFPTLSLRNYLPVGVAGGRRRRLVTRMRYHGDAMRAVGVASDGACGT